MDPGDQGHERTTSVHLTQLHNSLFPDVISRDTHYLEQELLHVQLPLKDWLIPPQRDLAEPRPEILEKRPLRGGRDDLLGTQQLPDVVKHALQNGVHERRSLICWYGRGTYYTIE